VFWREESKAKADKDHQLVHTCRKEEEKLKNDVGVKQGLYNEATRATREPCQREITTSTFTLSTQSYTLDCDLSEDAKCASNQADVDKQIDGSVTTLAGQVSHNVQAHENATTDCKNANATQKASRNEVLSSRSNLTSKHNTCQEKQRYRHEAVCSFGQKLQDACAAKSSYNTFVAKVGGTGFPESLSDREAELQTTEMVRCLLQYFVDNGNLTDTAVQSCGVVDMTPLTMNLQESDVEGYLEPSTSEFQITCAIPDSTGAGHEQLSVGKGTSVGKNITSNATWPLPYDLNLDKIEELTLPTHEQTIVYVESTQTEEFVVDESDDPFKVCSTVDDTSKQID